MNELGLSLIHVGDRRREDYGDIDALAASIAEHGLLHPVVVDAFGNLVAGGRRLRAVEQLGWTRIPVTRVGELTDVELHAVELEENLQRKDLTAIERSRTMVALVETAKETLGNVPRVSTNGRGPAPDPASDKRIAERIGVDPATIRNAREHVAAVEDFPELEPLPQAEAIRRARAISRPLDPDVVERQQRDTAVEQIDRCVYALEGNPEDIPAKVDWILETRDLSGRFGPLTPDRFERAADYCAAFAAELRRRAA